MTDDDLWQAILANYPNGPSAMQFSDPLNQSGGDNAGFAASRPAYSLDDLSSLMDAGVGSGVIAGMLPQLDPSSRSPAPGVGEVLFSSPSISSSPVGSTGIGQASQPPKATSDAGKQFIQNWEGYKGNIYPDAAGNPTFGYGHKLTDADAGLADDLKGMSDDQKQALANSMFDSDVKNHEQALYRQIGAHAVNALTQNQFDALVAASYNGGVGPRMIGDIKKGDNGAAEGEFNAYYVTKNVNGVPTKVINQGLYKRNNDERNMFVNGDYGGVP